MHNDPRRRRFIAGAVCPRCGLTDKMIVDVDADQRICVSCGFQESRPVDPAQLARQPAELPTRVTRAAARRVETSVQPLRFIDGSTSAGSSAD